MSARYHATSTVLALVALVVLINARFIGGPVWVGVVVEVVAMILAIMSLARSSWAIRSLIKRRRADG